MAIFLCFFTPERFLQRGRVSFNFQQDALFSEGCFLMISNYTPLNHVVPLLHRIYSQYDRCHKRNRTWLLFWSTWWDFWFLFGFRIACTSVFCVISCFPYLFPSVKIASLYIWVISVSYFNIQAMIIFILLYLTKFNWYLFANI